MLETTLWFTQAFLGLFFLTAGLPKIIGRGMDRWVGFDVLPRGMVAVTGVAEVAAAVALVVPMLLDRAEWTTPLAGVGLAIVTLMATGFHVRNSEWLPALETTLWASLASCVAIGRWDQLATGPDLSTDLLVAAMVVLVPAVIGNLVLLLSRQPAPAEDDAPVAAAAADPQVQHAS